MSASGADESELFQTGTTSGPSVHTRVIDAAMTKSKAVLNSIGKAGSDSAPVLESPAHPAVPSAITAGRQLLQALAVVDGAGITINALVGIAEGAHQREELYDQQLQAARAEVAEAQAALAKAEEQGAAHARELAALRVELAAARSFHEQQRLADQQRYCDLAESHQKLQAELRLRDGKVEAQEVELVELRAWKTRVTTLIAGEAPPTAEPKQTLKRPSEPLVAVEDDPETGPRPARKPRTEATTPTTNKSIGSCREPPAPATTPPQNTELPLEVKAAVHRECEAALKSVRYGANLAEPGDAALAEDCADVAVVILNNAGRPLFSLRCDLELYKPNGSPFLQSCRSVMLETYGSYEADSHPSITKMVKEDKLLAEELVVYGMAESPTAGALLVVAPATTAWPAWPFVIADGSSSAAAVFGSLEKVGTLSFKKSAGSFGLLAKRKMKKLLPWVGEAWIEKLFGEKRAELVAAEAAAAEAAAMAMAAFPEVGREKGLDMHGLEAMPLSSWNIEDEEVEVGALRSPHYFLSGSNAFDQHHLF